MNKYLAALAAAIGLVASGFATAAAGVVVTETETMVSGQPGVPPGQTRQRTMMIEGDKQKMIMDGGRSMIIDLDKGTMQIIDPAQKNYLEMPFPSHMMGQAVGGPAMHASEFTKTGKTRTIAGSKCEEYNGSGKFPMGEFTVVSCVSTKAPGAAEFAKFQKTMMTNLKENQLPMPANFPDGIPLAQDTTTTVKVMNMPNLSPQAAEQLKKQFANHPPIVTKTEVTKVEAQKIAASEFEIPAGYTKREMTGHQGGMGGHPGGMGGPAMGGAGGSSGGAPAAGAPPTANP
jgi:uncharacterized membrane protein YgcG